MVLCPYGSAPKPGAPPFVWLTWLDAKSWLGSVFPELAPFSYLVPPVLAEINAFCATEPPQPTALSDADIVAAATDPVKFEALIQFIKDSIYWAVWSNQCVCNPNPGSPPSCAGGWANSFLPVAVGPGGSQFLIGTRFTSLQIGAQFSGFRVWTPQAYNYAVGLTLWTAAGAIVVGTTIAAGIPAGYHEFNVAPVTLTAGQDYIVSICVQVGYLWASDSTAPVNDVVAAWVSHLYATACGTFPTTVSGGWGGIQPILCVAASPTPPGAPPVPTITTPPFPTESACTTQDVCDLVQQLLQSVTLLRTMVDLIQRQEVPFGYILGTTHPGLTGSGTISVQGLLGLAVHLSTVPGFWGLSSDYPQRYIPAPATTAVGTANGDQDTHFFHLTDELWFPVDMGAMTHVRYEFKPGCVGSITELIREP